MLQHTHDVRVTSSADRMLSALASPGMYNGDPTVAVHETHASWVFVAGERAYKVKKPVRLGFLDYSTLARRRAACHEEVRVNQPLAADIYLGVLAIIRSGAGFRFASPDASDALEYAVEMRTFSDEDTFDGLARAGDLTRGYVAALARLLADFHRGAPVVDDWGPDRVLAAWHRNVSELEQIRPPEDWHVEVAARFGETFVWAHAGKLTERARSGFARDGHGDLRCEHVLARPAPRVVDRIEFDPQLRRTDVACDLAFLAMDLEALGQRWAVGELVKAYEAAGMNAGDETLRSFYGAHWAIVRAKVALVAASEHEAAARNEHERRAEDMWTLSERLCWRARGSRVIVICGPSATGKSVLATELSRRSEMPVISSDLVRKRLAKLSASDRAEPAYYGPRFTQATYERLARDTLSAVRDAAGVIVDATFRRRRDRRLLLDRLHGVSDVVFVRCDVPLELALERAANRLDDPQRVSDATPEIAAEQYREFEELDELSAHSRLKLDATQSLDQQVAQVTDAVDCRASAGRS